MLNVTFARREGLLRVGRSRLPDSRAIFRHRAGLSDGQPVDCCLIGGGGPASGQADQQPYTAALHDASAGRPQQGVDQPGTGFGFVHRERYTPVTPASCSQSCEAARSAHRPFLKQGAPEPLRGTPYSLRSPPLPLPDSPAHTPHCPGRCPGPPAPTRVLLMRRSRYGRPCPRDRAGLSRQCSRDTHRQGQPRGVVLKRPVWQGCAACGTGGSAWRP